VTNNTNDGLSGISPNKAKKLQGMVSTVAGNGEPGNRDGLSDEAMFDCPRGLVVDEEGNVFVSDWRNEKIKKISKGVVTTLKGDKIGYPRGMAIDKKKNLLIVCGQQIVRMTLQGVINIIAGSGKPGFADGICENAMFNCPFGIALDGKENIFVADRKNHRIRMISDDGKVSTIAGNGLEGCVDGSSTSASFNLPYGIVLDSNGDIFVADCWNHRIRKICKGMVSTFAGSKQGFADGEASKAMLSYPTGLALDAERNIYVADWGNDRIRRVTPQGFVTTVAGSGKQGYADGAADVSMFNYPIVLSFDIEGNLYVADQNNHCIRKII